LLASDIDVYHYIIAGKLLILFATYDENQNQVTGDLIEHMGHLFHKSGYCAVLLAAF
jgi:hypothetical protein